MRINRIINPYSKCVWIANPDEREDYELRIMITLVFPEFPASKILKKP